MESNCMGSGTRGLMASDTSWRAASLSWHADKHCEIWVALCIKLSSLIVSLWIDIAARMLGFNP